MCVMCACISDGNRGLEYYLDVRTGFSNFASSFDPTRPKQVYLLSLSLFFMSSINISIYADYVMSKKL